MKAKLGYKLANWRFGKKIEIPEKWKVVSLGESCVKIQDSDHSMPKKIQKGIPFLSISHIVDKSEIDFSETEFVSEEYYKKFIKKVDPTKNDLLYSRVATIGEARLIRENKKFAFTYNVVLIRSTKSVYPEFLLYQLNNPLIKNYVKFLAPSSAYAFLGLSDIKKILIIIPPTIEEQKKITDILSNVDKAIQNVNELIEQTLLLKKGIMKKLLTKGINHIKFKNEKWYFRKKIEIPNDWQIKSLSQIGKIIGGGTPDSIIDEYWNGEISWAIPSDLTNLDGNYISKTAKNISKKGLEKSSAKLLSKGTILITSRATIGECAINTVEMTTNQGFQNLICNKQNNALFMFYAIQFHKNQLFMLANGTTFLEISNSNMKKVRIFTPDLPEQKEIALILSNIDSKIEKLQIKQLNLELLKKGLIQKLLIGEMRVKF